MQTHWNERRSDRQEMEKVKVTRNEFEEKGKYDRSKQKSEI